jgi:hypothetical protein
VLLDGGRRVEHVLPRPDDHQALAQAQRDPKLDVSATSTSGRGAGERDHSVGRSQVVHADLSKQPGAGRFAVEGALSSESGNAPSCWSIHREVTR